VLSRLRARTPRDFYERFLRLSSVIAWTDGAEGEATAWTNPSARIAIDRLAVASLAGALATPSSRPPRA
jgi:hypothetical protein